MTRTLSTILILGVVLLTFVQLAWTQGTSGLPSVAVLAFKGDSSITPAQLDFITGKFTSELIATGAFRVLDRSRMDVILQEQGFQSSGACDSGECQVQIGQLLGVDNLVAGSMVRFGREFAFRIDYVDVGSGQIVNTVELAEKGALEDVYKTMSAQGARELARVVRGKDPTEQAKQTEQARNALPLQNEAKKQGLSWQRKTALALWTAGLAGVGGGVYFNQRMISAGDDYDAVFAQTNPSLSDANNAYQDLQDARTARNASYGVAAGSVVLGALLWIWGK